MKNDYLWDKTGADREIEKLENALQEFRYQRNEPPVLPVKSFQFEPAKTKSFWKFGLAFASFAAIALFVILAFQFQRATPKANVNQDLAQKVEIKITEQTFPSVDKPKDAEISSKVNSYKKPKAVSAEKVSISQRPVRFELVKTAQKVSLNVRSHKTFAQNNETKKPTEETLTKEEKSAYDQLMLALSIAGENLKIVKDKVESTENSNAFEAGK